jgi:glycerophosphoryl diester phosphodiesterase
VFAHRGGRALAPENTLAAFDRGLALEADGLELDVHLAADGVVVVHHDHDLARTTDLRGPIGGRTADELARADAGFWFRLGPPGGPDALRAAREEFPLRGRGIGIPTLDAVLNRYKDARIIIELKTSAGALARATVDVVRRARALERVCVGSFSTRALREVRALEPRLATSASREEVRWTLYRLWCRWPRTRASYQGYQVPEWAGRTRVVSPRFVSAAHAAGLSVQVWTVDNEADADRLVAWGVDALITDRPDVLVPFVRQRTRRPR